MADLVFFDPMGETIVHDATIEIDGATARITVVLDADTWDRCEERNLFGTHTRRRMPAALPGVGDVKITVEGPATLVDPIDATTRYAAIPAEAFVITNAMRRMTQGDPAAWHGVVFASPPSWQRALDALRADGFVDDDEFEDQVLLADGRGTTVVIADDEVSALAGVVVNVVLSEVPPSGIDHSRINDVLEVINGFNASSPVGTVALEGPTLIVRAGFPVTDRAFVGDLLAELATGLVRLSEFLADPIGKLAAGTISRTDAEVALLD